ncbi:MAG: DUF4199 domain-containing protein [Bacteroidales bacterium]|nr:DUF4199 domain-containing protein [Bacteroidales bacterium]
MEKETKKSSLASSAFTYGLITAVGMIVLTLLMYVLNLMTVQWISYLAYVIILAGIIWGTLKFRDEDSGGFISYGKALGYGTLLSLFAALISGVFIFVFYQYIAPDAMEQLKAVAAENVLEANPEITDQQLDMILRFTSPIVISISSIFSTTFLGFVFSLVTSAFIKRKDPEEM